MKSLWLFATLIFLIPLSCSKAKFQGTGEAKTLQLSCNPSLNQVETGQNMLILVNASQNFEGEIKQTIKLPNGKTQVNDLKRQGSAFVADAQSGNSFTFNETGNYRVELAANDDEKTTASCVFAVVPPKCEDAKEIIGVNVAFIIDNSHSTGTTDCPSRNQIGFFNNDPNNVPNYRCNDQTFREKAVIRAASSLKRLSESAQIQNELTSSQIGVGYFPTKDDYNGYISGSRVTTNAWIRTETDPNQLTPYLSFTREPYGMTPYGSGLEAAGQLFGQEEYNDQRQELIVFVTDGEPTDQNPVETARIAADLHGKGVTVATVFVNTNNDREARADEHLRMLRNSSGAWYDRQQYRSFDAYAVDLLGSESELSLVDKITSKRDKNCQDKPGQTCLRNFVQVNDWNQLDTVLDGIVRSSVQCR